MIKSFRHKGFETFFRTGKKSGIQVRHAAKLAAQLGVLSIAEGPEEMNLSGWRLHRLDGKFKGFWSVTINGNWRLVFRFDGHDAESVDYLDYH